jgi:signal transduction histidine kinase
LPRVGIRALLIILLLPGVVALLVIDSLNDYRTLSEITNEAYDSALVEPARVLESSLEFTPDGALQVATPLYAQVMLESRAGLRKYFRIEQIDPPLPDDSPVPAEQGKTLLGMPDLPRPPTWPRSNGLPVFYDGVYRNDPVRVVSLVRDLYYQGAHRQVLVLVAESTGKRIEAENNARRQEILRDARMLALVVLLVWWGVSWALKPLRRLRADIRNRRPDDLTPLDASRVPSEVAPLVDAVNHHIARYRRVLEEQSHFLADASHQLRTPLAIMLTQAQYALRERDPARAQEGLRAIVDQLGRTRRLTEQLLSLAHANQADPLPRQLLDMNAAGPWLGAGRQRTRPGNRRSGVRQRGRAARGAVQPGAQRHPLRVGRRPHHRLGQPARRPGRGRRVRQRPRPGTDAARPRLRPLRARRHRQAGGLIGVGPGAGHRPRLYAAQRRRYRTARRRTQCAGGRGPGLGAVVAAGDDRVAVSAARRRRVHRRTIIPRSFHSFLLVRIAHHTVFHQG